MGSRVPITNAGRTCRSRARRASAARWIPRSRSRQPLSHDAGSEKIGEPAIDEIERGLTPAVLRSTKPEDIQYIETVLRVLISIGGSAPAPVLIRAAIAAHDWQSRELAFNGVVWPAFEFIPMRPGRPWEVCLRTESRYACPFDSEGPRVAAVVKPLLGVVRDHMARESHAQVRAAAAQLLALWGAGELRSAGEKELLTLAARPDDTNTQEAAIRVLGLLGVEAARDVIKTRTAGGKAPSNAPPPRRWPT